MGNGLKIEKMVQRTNQNGLDFLTRADHMTVSLWQEIAHGRVPTKPKFSPIQKQTILRALSHSKAYKYTLEEEKRRDIQEEARNCSRKAD
ncbi:D-amino acid dehydrogenase small subunit [Gossypium arboreum]|uniref:D-amino acid dehydrogenase small subunit n=1 Tax=Gossypium arboreum TaxID=29729 RepID=A0A0B0N2Y5_GOSAR|nr:D-amino acid dehydrogenase small subunit [Gossypium arboreum]